MGKIVRHEFLGSRFLFILLCLTGIGIPAAVLYLIKATVTIEEELDNPTEFLEAFRAGKVVRKPRAG